MASSTGLLSPCAPCAIATFTGVVPRTGSWSTKSPCARVVAGRASAQDHGADAQAAPAPSLSRRAVLAASAGGLLATAGVEHGLAAPAQSLPKEDETDIKLCDPSCEANMEQFPLQSTPSGLQYRDIVQGKGPSPPVGFQVAADYVAMIPTGRVFDSSIEKKTPYIFRVGSGQVVPGLDEGVLTMGVGGLRRLYIPGSLAFPKGLPSAPGRPRVAPYSPVIFDVKLLYVPGLEFDEEEPASEVTSPAEVDSTQPETSEESF